MTNSKRKTKSNSSRKKEPKPIPKAKSEAKPHSDDLLTANERRARFTARRRQVFAALFAAFVLNTVAKRALGAAAPRAVQRGEIQASELGECAAAVALAYALTKPLGGVLADQVDSLRLLRLGLALAAIAVALLAIAPTRELRLAAAALLGASQAPAWPAVARPLAAWYGQRTRAQAWSVMSAAQTAGGALAAALIGNVAQHSASLAAPLGVASAGALLGAFLLPPVIGAAHPRGLGMSVHDDFDVDDAPTDVSASQTLSLSALLAIAWRSRNVWRYALSALALYVVKELFATWFAVMMDETGFSGQDKLVSSFIVCFELSGVPGCFAASIASDRYFNSSRSKAAAAFSAVLIASLCALKMTDSQSNAILIYTGMAASGFCINAIQTLTSLGYVEENDRRASGTISGIVGLAAYGGAFAASMYFTNVAAYFDNSMSAAFYNVACASAVITALAFVSVPKRRIAPAMKYKTN